MYKKIAFVLSFALTSSFSLASSFTEMCLNSLDPAYSSETMKELIRQSGHLPGGQRGSILCSKVETYHIVRESIEITNKQLANGDPIVALGERSIATLIDLSNNAFRSFDGLDMYWDVEVLKLNQNRIRNIDDLGLLPETLTHLELRSNRITSLQAYYLPDSLTSIDLTGNNITTLSGVEYYPNDIEEVILCPTNTTARDNLIIEQSTLNHPAVSICP